MIVSCIHSYIQISLAGTIPFFSGHTQKNSDIQLSMKVDYIIYRGKREIVYLKRWKKMDFEKLTC